jgi:hypothetical protein
VPAHAGVGEHFCDRGQSPSHRSRYSSCVLVAGSASSHMCAHVHLPSNRHTMGHICYYATSKGGGEKAVFTGDTLVRIHCHIPSLAVPLLLNVSPQSILPSNSSSTCHPTLPLARTDTTVCRRCRQVLRRVAGGHARLAVRQAGGAPARHARLLWARGEERGASDEIVGLCVIGCTYGV